jgi:hypothetical protein
VAVKVDNRVLGGDRDRRRFVREVTAAGRLSGHPHVIDLYDAGTLADGRPYLVMELCPAGSLNDALRRHGPMGAARVRDIGVRICDALAAAHAAGVLHRDIKPGNILVNRYGLVGLADFGLAAIMAAEGGQSPAREALTPAYAPPETFRGEEPTVAADIYSAAATLYALLAGRPPRFPADSRSPGIATIMALHDRPIDDVPGAPPELMALLRRGLAADPATRPPSAASVRDALASLSMQPGPPPPQAARQPQPGGVPAGDVPGGVPAGQASLVHARRRTPVLLSLAVAAGLVLIGGATLVGALVLHGTGAAGGTASGGPGARPVSVPAAGVFGIPTVTSGCPAASVPAARARCPRSPECWNALAMSSGGTIASSLPCTQPHVWETFAIAILPAGVRTFDQDIVEANPTVGAVCSMHVLLASRLGAAREIPQGSWQIQVLPPDQAAFERGTRAYRCVAHQIGGTSPGSEFGVQPGNGGRGRGGPGGGKDG